MPWCPKCKNEYREGITICADCQVELVEDLSSLDNDESTFQPLFITTDEALMSKFSSYADYSDIHRYSVIYNAETGEYTFNVHPDEYDLARKLYRGFAITESENQAMAAEESVESDNTDIEEIDLDDSESIIPSDIISETDEDMPEISNDTYVRKSDRFKDYRFSAYTCILCGAVGIIFCIFNMTGILSLFANIFSQIVMLVMFALFLIGGIYMWIKSNSIRSEIDEETQLEDRVKTWLSINITSGYINSLKDQEIPDEVNYLNICNEIRRSLMTDIPEAPIEMIDTLIEEYISEFEA